MSTRLFTLALLALAAASTAQAQTQQPDPYAARMALGAASYTWQGVRPPTTGAIQNGVPQFGAAPQLAAQASQRRAASIGLRQGAAPATKPFNTVVRQPTVSPYLNLFRDEDEDQGLPNYYAFVRPQLQQQQQQRQRTEQLQSLERRGQQASYAAPAPTAPSRAARYGDTSRFYGGWR